MKYNLEKTLKLKIRTSYKDVILYLMSTLVFVFPVLVNGLDGKAAIGFYVGCTSILILKKDIRALSFYFLIIALNYYLLYVPLIPLPITVTSLIRIYPILIIIYEFCMNPKLILDSRMIISFPFVVVWICYFSLNSFMNDLSVPKMLWQSTILLYTVLLQILVIKSNGFRKDLIISLFVAALVFIAVGYFELIQEKTFFYSTWAGIRYRNGIFRVGSMQGDPNTMAMYAVPLLFVFSTQTAKKILGQGLIVVFNFTLVVLVILSGSRTSLIALIFAWGLLYIYRHWKIRRIIVFGVAVLAIFFAPVIFNVLWHIDIASSGQRLKLVFNAINLWKEHYLIGIGFDQYYKLTQWMTMNEYIKQLTEFGLIGIVFYLTYWFRCFIKIFFSRNFYKVKKIQVGDNIYMAAALLSWCINAFSMDSFYHYVAWVFPALILLFGFEGRENGNNRR